MEPLASARSGRGCPLVEKKTKKKKVGGVPRFLERSGGAAEMSEGVIRDEFRCCEVQRTGREFPLGCGRLGR